MEEGKKKSLWGLDEEEWLNNVTMNIGHDDEMIKSDIKGKNVMKWDSKKKRY